MDRVRELGDASVPFQFDVHAMIFSDDAPALETTLHKAFTQRRVNRINERKEFFQVDLAEIAALVKRHRADIEFKMVPEAEEYRKTQALLASEAARGQSAVSLGLPSLPTAASGLGRAFPPAESSR